MVTALHNLKAKNPPSAFPPPAPEGYMNPKTCPPPKRREGATGIWASGSELVTHCPCWPRGFSLPDGFETFKLEYKISSHGQWRYLNFGDSWWTKIGASWTIDKSPRSDPLGRTNQWWSKEIMGELSCEARRKMYSLNQQWTIFEYREVESLFQCQKQAKK